MARSKRRHIREVIVSWRAEAQAAASTRKRAVERLSAAVRGRIKHAFYLWRQKSRVSGVSETAANMLRRIAERRHSDRVGMRLALRSWNRNTGGRVLSQDDRPGEARTSAVPGGMEDDRLEVLAGLAVDAAAAFSTATSVRWCDVAGEGGREIGRKGNFCCLLVRNAYMRMSSKKKV